MAQEDHVSDASLQQAFEAWIGCLSPDHVVQCGPRLAAINRSTFQHTSRLAGAIYPASRQDIARCLEVARVHRVPLHVVSRGRNWGYGSRLPARPWTVLMSLERMTRLEIDERLAKVGLEPGVTFGQLQQSLRERHSALLAPEIGAGPDPSVLGNALQRGIGKGPYTSMGAQILALDVLLADGTLIETDGAGVFRELSPSLHPRSTGPAIAGLFQQSDFGIVLAGSLALVRAPHLRQLTWCRIAGEQLPDAIEAIRPLLQLGCSRLQVEIINGQRARQQTFDALALDVDRIDSEWLIAATVWADDKKELLWRRSAIERAFTFPLVERGRFTIERRADFSQPDWSGLNSAYTFVDVKPGPGADPDGDGCGLIWLAPEVPFIADLVRPLLSEIGEIIGRFGISPAVSMRPANGRDLRVLIGLAFDRDREGEDKRAVDCADAVRQHLTRSGFGFYRTGLLDRDANLAHAGRRNLLPRLARALDPSGILSGVPAFGDDS